MAKITATTKVPTKINKGGRPRKDKKFNDKLDKYLNTYELDDLNKANDYQSLVQLCRLELYIERLQQTLDSMKDLSDEPKKTKDLNTALKDAIQAYLNLQDKLGINRSQRVGDSDETPLSYIEKLKEQSKKYLDSRLTLLRCPSCNTQIMKHIIYVKEKGEVGSIKHGNNVEPIRYNISVECPRCGTIAREGNFKEVGTKETAFGTDGTEQQSIEQSVEQNGEQGIEDIIKENITEDVTEEELTEEEEN